MSMPTKWMHVVVATSMLVMASGCTGTPELSLDNGTSTPSALNTATNSVMSETPDLLEIDTGTKLFWRLAPMLANRLMCRRSPQQRDASQCIQIVSARAE
jgi:hypothetical protein